MTDFDLLYTQYFRRVYRFELSLCRDAALAEEVTQEAFVRGMQHADRFDGRCDVLTWLCQIAKNEYYQTLRRSRRTSPHPTVPPDASPTPEAWLFGQDRLERIHAHLHGMDEPYREVFTLRVLGELSHRQIAALFGKSEAWARTTFYRAKVRLQERMMDDEREP